MTNNNFSEVIVIVGDKKYNVKIERNTSFGNNGGVYQVDEKGRLTKQGQKVDAITMTKYQFGIFKAMADNNKEKAGDIVLSHEDIDKALEMFQNSQLSADLSKELKGYSLQNFKVYSQDNIIKFEVHNDVKNRTDATLRFSYDYYLESGAESESKKSTKETIKQNVDSSYNESSVVGTEVSTQSEDTQVKPKEAKPQAGSETTSDNPTQNEPTSLKSYVVSKVMSVYNYFKDKFVGSEEPAQTPTKTSKPKKSNGTFTGNGIYDDSRIQERSSFIHTVKSGDTLVKLAIENGVDTYSIIAANPQLKEGKDYKVTYRKNNTAIIEMDLSINQKLRIPASYSVKPGSVTSLEDVAQITGVSIDYIKETLVGSEGFKADTYKDSGGIPTIGYGHIGRVDGKPLSLKNPIHIDEPKALELLAGDILEHNARAMSYLGVEEYQNAPQSVRDTILDIVYNKGIWDGFKNPYHTHQTSKIKQDLKEEHYASALAHTPRTNNHQNSSGLDKRNIIRFLNGLKDLPIDKQRAAMEAFRPTYEESISKLHGDNKARTVKAWEDAQKRIFA